MNTSPRHLLYKITSAGILVIMLTALAACASSYAPASPTSAEPTTESPSAPKLQTVNGTISSIKGNTVTLSTAAGQTTVNVGTDTAVAKAAPGAASDLAPGQLLIITGTPDSSGKVTATTIAIRPQVPDAPLPSADNGSYVGILTTLNGNTLTITTAQTTPVQVNVTITAKTTVQKTISGTLTDLNADQKVTVVGTVGNNGAINAVSISGR